MISDYEDKDGPLPVELVLQDSPGAHDPSNELSGETMLK
jgi:hypothetical protein